MTLNDQAKIVAMEDHLGALGSKTFPDTKIIVIFTLPSRLKVERRRLGNFHLKLSSTWDSKIMLTCHFV